MLPFLRPMGDELLTFPPVHAMGFVAPLLEIECIFTFHRLSWTASPTFAPTLPPLIHVFCSDDMPG